ncbi:MAG: hypothetical protein II564_03755 [Oscillospiraceae bacterium]|nr:hypothetical protein [Oscillospiraceae bacterium]
MFGYVIINQSDLSEEELLRYRQCYCGLCHSLKERSGNLSRLMLTFDLTFLTLLLQALYEKEERENTGPCIIHPFKKQSWWQSEITDYAADMTVLLGYQKLMDDWNDDCNPLRLWESLPFKRHYRRVAQRYPRQSEVLEDRMAKLSFMEIQGEQDPDKAAGLFGDIMAEIFVYQEDYWSDTLRKMGQALGRFIYLMDAVVDLEKDRKTGNYNPLKELPDSKDNHYRDFLEMLLGETVYYFDRLPIVDDVQIIKNILCSGVWSEYMRKFYPDSEESEKGE